ncbi:chitin-binding type-2 domain-containing protein [Nephila pilipes]|uniref:Chitin-binding type-2 domain-containing protein n=1 Tax=Nephila pilipes TaxID=299642 RepID=A0A8X6IE62_NEPPI|nr:chitin-binding type-2 domain-containing protein [Nephila pilipes]
MKFCILGSLLLSVALAVVAPKRAKREAYELPDGADILVGPVKTSFSCFNDGYYADVDNNCQIFHVCHSIDKDDGSRDTQQWSFVCGNQTLFNQLTLTCADPENAIPCPDAPSFYSINDRINAGDPKLYFLTDDDIQRAEPLLYRNREGDYQPNRAGPQRG